MVILDILDEPFDILWDDALTEYLRNNYYIDEYDDWRLKE